MYIIYYSECCIVENTDQSIVASVINDIRGNIDLDRISSNWAYANNRTYIMLEVSDINNWIGYK